MLFSRNFAYLHDGKRDLSLQNAIKKPIDKYMATINISGNRIRKMEIAKLNLNRIIK